MNTGNNLERQNKSNRSSYAELSSISPTSVLSPVQNNDSHGSCPFSLRCYTVGKEDSIVFLYHEDVWIDNRGQ